MASNERKKSGTKSGATAENRRIRPERRSATERRAGADRRKNEQPVAVERRVADRRAEAPHGERRKVERRINEYPLDAEVLEFINAVNEFKSVQQKPFPTWSDIHGIFTKLGYRREK
ncbi:MAG: hypothetical protein ACYTGZ_08515 [Planctomycetota bacterium]|jgi:hypothetical protein